MAYELIGVPFSSIAGAGGIATASRVLREAGLLDRLAGAGTVVDGGELALAEGDGRRGASGLLDETALLGLFETTRVVSGHSMERGNRPLLYGGDCPALLGPIVAARDRGLRIGLLHVDGHEDAWPPRLSPTGEASDSEIWIALGSRPEDLPDPLRGLVPLLEPEAVAMLGPRDLSEIESAGLSSLREEVAWFGDDEALLEAPAWSARTAIDAIGPAASAFWLHLDLDVLRAAELAAVDYPQAGGIGWSDLAELASTALANERCIGASISIYNPDLDPDRTGARRIVELVAQLVA